MYVTKMHPRTGHRSTLSVGTTASCSSLLLLLACCAPSGTGAAPPSDDSTAGAAPSGPTSAPGDDDPRTDLTDEAPRAWTSFDEVSETALRVHVMTGDLACFGLRAEVDETPTEVLVTVYEGTLPDAPEACTAVGRDASLRVELAEPLGDRPVSQPP